MTDAKHVKEKLIKMGIDQSSISIIYFGTDTNYFTPGKTDVRKKYGLDENSKIIYSNRSLHPVYDIETIVRSAKILPDYTFIISGGGPLEEELKGLALKLSLSNIIFVGRIPFEDLRDFLRECEVYVSASKSDAGLAASIAEAMSCGAPVVCSDFGDNIEWIEETSSGLVFEIGNASHLAEKISQIVDSPETYKGGREKIERDNNSEIEMLKATNIYSKTLNV
jgi:glycosyltransferase involved in cell wall biosynthesis